MEAPLRCLISFVPDARLHLFEASQEPQDYHHHVLSCPEHYAIRAAARRVNFPFLSAIKRGSRDWCVHLARLSWFCWLLKTDAGSLLEMSSIWNQCPFLWKPEFLKKSSRYHNMVLGHHKGIYKLHPVQIWRLNSHWFRFWSILKYYRLHGIFAYLEHFSRDKRVPCNRNRVYVKPHNLMYWALRHGPHVPPYGFYQGVLWYNSASWL